MPPGLTEGRSDTEEVVGVGKGVGAFKAGSSGAFGSSGLLPRPGAGVAGIAHGAFGVGGAFGAFGAFGLFGAGVPGPLAEATEPRLSARIAGGGYSSSSSSISSHNGSGATSGGGGSGRDNGSFLHKKIDPPQLQPQPNTHGAYTYTSSQGAKKAAPHLWSRNRPPI
jgi:hypothetical protein